jgi:hypothetical protein
MPPVVNLGFPPTTIPISAATIDRIFAWDDSVTANLAHVESYARVIEDLLATPTGRGLIRRIIVTHHNDVRLSPVIFTRDMGDNRSKSDWYNDPLQCKINLEWYEGQVVSGKKKYGRKSVKTWSAVNEPMWDSWVLLVCDSGANRLDFKRVDVPPALVLAHELGHFLYGINMQQQTMNKLNRDCVQDAIGDVVNHMVSHSGEMNDPANASAVGVLAKNADGQMDVWAYVEYKNIFRGVVDISRPLLIIEWRKFL